MYAALSDCKFRSVSRVDAYGRRRHIVLRIKLAGDFYVLNVFALRSYTPVALVQRVDIPQHIEVISPTAVVHAVAVDVGRLYALQHDSAVRRRFAELCYKHLCLTFIHILWHC